MQHAASAHEIAIGNIGQSVSGNWREPFASADAVVIDGERMASLATH
jgi:hypothetical protein